MSTTGKGRLLLLWANSGYCEYEDFCLNESKKIREMRRLFMMASGWIFRRHVKYLNSESFKVTLSGDVGAEQSTLDHFYSTWDRKGDCCVPAGLAKELKRMNVTSADLKSPDWQQTMYNVAATLQLSMADVEAMHSRNRVLARSAFSSISAKFINEESRRYMEEALVLQKPQQAESTAHGQHANQTSKRSGLVIKGPALKMHNCKGQSALEIFRKRYLTEKQTTEKVNPCDKTLWAEIKTAFENLPDDQRAIYTRMAEQSKEKAFSERAKKNALKSIANRSASVEDVVATQQIRESTVIHAQVLPMWKLGDVMSKDASVEKLATAVAKNATSTGSDIVAKSVHPITEGTLETAFVGMASNRLTGRQAESMFNQEAERIARPPDDDIFPDRVVHEGACGELCRFRTVHERIAMHQHIEGLFLEIVRAKGGVKGAVNSDILCGLLMKWQQFPMIPFLAKDQWASQVNHVTAFLHHLSLFHLGRPKDFILYDEH